MTLIVDILARAARQTSVLAPSNWAAADTATTLELIDFMHETADDVLQRVDLTQPIAETTTITGTGVEGYSLPAAYKRMQRDSFAVYEEDKSRRPCIPVGTDGMWEYLKDLGASGAQRYYRVRGYEGNFEIDFFPALPTGSTVVVNFVTENWIAGGKAAFTDVLDVSMIPRRIMETGTVARYRQRKGLEFTDKLAEYEALMARMTNDTNTVRSVDMAGGRVRDPFDVPIPDYIPSS